MHKKEDSELIQLITHAIEHATETSNIEFKDTRGGFPAKTIWKTISSFSNTKGGFIVFGVSEHKITRKLELCGTTDLAELQERFVGYIQNAMSHAGIFDFRILTIGGKYVLVISITETTSDLKPCFYKKFGMHKCACIREGNVDRLLTAADLKAFIRISSDYKPDYKYDKTRAEDTSIDMLDMDKVKSLLVKSAERARRKYIDALPQQKALRKLGIIADFDGIPALTIAGFLIFSKDTPQDINTYSRYEVRCVAYQGDSIATPILDKQDVFGTLDEQINTCHNFILKNITRSAKIVGTQRKEKYIYPEKVIRELIINAISHRDYMITGTFTQVHIFSNRIEISNAGKLPSNVPIEFIAETNFSRNESIASILHVLNYGEEMGNGIPLVLHGLAEWNLLRPIFKNASNVFKVIVLNLPKDSLSIRQMDMWQMITSSGSMSAKDFEHTLHISRSAVLKDLNKLTSLGLISKEGVTRDVVYRSKY